jgi:hypothetical protein
VPTLRHLTAKLLPSLIVAFASLTALCTILSMSELVFFAGETEEMPKTRVNLAATSVAFFVFM